MLNRWLSSINLLLIGCSLLLLCAIVGLLFAKPSAISYVEVSMKKHPLPKGSFVWNKKSYDAIGAPFLSLKQTCPTMQLPDLSKHLVYHGTNGRPDAGLEKTLLYFSLNMDKNVAAIPPDEPLYLAYDKTQSPPHYIFSPNNAKTPLWIIGSRLEGQVAITSKMEDEKGGLIICPKSHASFTLPEKDFARIASGNTWEISSKWRADGTLLARQHARWFGKDLFLDQHGGEEYQASRGKERIDFGEGEETYSCFVGLGEGLVWENERWNPVTLGPASLDKPLLYVKRIDERLMNFELWNVNGKGKVILNLLKSNENWNGETLERDFRFVGARTRSQCVFEIDNERVLLRPQDWLLLTDEGWKKLDSVESIDDYVNRKETGTLFVFDGITKKDQTQVLVGTLFNPSRTTTKDIELAIHQSNVSISPQSVDEYDDEFDDPLLKPLLPIAKSRSKNNHDDDEYDD